MSGRGVLLRHWRSADVVWGCRETDTLVHPLWKKHVLGSCRSFRTSHTSYHSRFGAFRAAAGVPDSCRVVAPGRIIRENETNDRANQGEVTVGQANGRANAALLAETPAQDGRPGAVYRSAGDR